MKDLFSDSEIRELTRQLPNEMIEKSLMLRYRYLVGCMVNELRKGRGLDFDDCVSCGNLGLLSAIRTFRNTKNVTFIEHAKGLIKYEVLLACSNEIRYNDLKLDDYNDKVEEDIAESACRRVDAEAVCFAVSFLPDKQRCTVELFHGLNGKAPNDQRQVAEILGYTQQYISPLLHKAYENLLKMYEDGTVYREREREKRWEKTGFNWT